MSRSSRLTKAVGYWVFVASSMTLAQAGIASIPPMPIACLFQSLRSESDWASLHSTELAQSKPQTSHAKDWLIIVPRSSDPSRTSWMEETTFRDPCVIEWLEKHAVVGKVNIDTEPEAAVALGLRHSEMAIACKGNEEFDRVVGYLSPSEFLAWLEGLDRGEKYVLLFQYPSTYTEMASTLTELPARLKRARDLSQSGDYSSAANSYIAMWNELRTWEPTMTGVAVQPVAQDVKNLAATSSIARNRFLEFRAVSLTS